MGICDDPEILKAYDDVCDDKSKLNWILLTFADAKSNALTVGHKGEGGIDQLKEHLSDEEAAFGYIRVTMSNDEHSQRTKYVLISWIGSRVSYMRRARLSVQKSDVTKVLRYFSIEVPATELSEVDAKDIDVQLKKAGGANYDRQTSDY
ncbi:hypothetical protein IWW50_003685 [Coemansia erecta]|nr:hypothetical protein GGF43_003237 [Coemansia sp. RSA 2618]KAJ2823660.1 hypothetical protein IWW50_003685 [Coemansia erecta]